MNVLLTKKFMPSDIEYLQNGLADEISLVEPDEYTESGVLAKIDNADALLGGMFTDSILAAAKSVRLFQVPWTGVDNIDFALLEKHNIDCVCNSHSNGSVVAEHALALYFAVAKKIPYHDSQLRGGNWNRVSPDGNEVSPFSRSLIGRKVVFVGYGAVNRSIHQLLSGFTPEVTVVNRSGELTGDLPAIDKVVNYGQIVSALDGADVVFVALPLTSESADLFDQECFSALSDNTILINVARGTIVNEEALYRALADKKIYGAGIDTWYQYPKPGASTSTLPSSEFPFHDLHNLVLSPHRAGYVDSGFPHLDDAIANLNNLNSGKPLLNRLSVEHRY